MAGMNYSINVTVQTGPQTEPETEPVLYGDAPFGGTDVTVPRSLATAKFYYELKAGLVDGTRIALAFITLREYGVNNKDPKSILNYHLIKPN
eukprot:12875-Heterococcus_DN1.PRE.1